MSAVACSVCYGSGYGVDGKPCPCGCRPAPAIALPVAAHGGHLQESLVSLYRYKAMPRTVTPGGPIMATITEVFESEPDDTRIIIETSNGGTRLLAEKISAPLAAGSVDTEEFRNLLEYWVNSETEAYKASELGNLISHINAWGAQQREAGRQEGYADGRGMANEIVAAIDKANQVRAEKAEARVKELESTSTARMGKSLLRPAISADNPLSPGCYCEPGKCAAPKIMGRQTPCRDPEKASGIKK